MKILILLALLVVVGRTDCTSEQDLVNEICIEKCATGFIGVEHTCHYVCPEGFAQTEDYTHCIKTPASTTALTCRRIQLRDPTTGYCYEKCPISTNPYLSEVLGTPQVDRCLSASYTRATPTFNLQTLKLPPPTVTSYCPPYSKNWVEYGPFITAESQYLSTTQLGAPTYFITNVTSVIRCVHRAALEMKVGQRAVVTCPAEYCYGDKGVPGVVSENARFSFIMEIVKCQQF